LIFEPELPERTRQQSLGCSHLMMKRSTMKKLLIAASLVAMTASVQAAQDPEAVYNKACLACHAAGVAGAPKKGDAEAWAPRLAKGTDALLASVKNGLNAMPAGGLCTDCSDEDYKAVIEWMSK